MSLTYLNRMEAVYPDLQQEVFGEVILIINSPRIGYDAQFTFRASQRQGYVVELDLLSLASMVDSYNMSIIDA